MPLQKFLENTLHGKAKLFVTKCTLAKITKEHEKELKAAGKVRPGMVAGRPEFLPPPTEVPLRHCKHNEEGAIIGEADCLVDLLAGQPKGNEIVKNKQHFVLASADVEEREMRKRDWVDIREAARNIPGVPIVYVKRSVMILEELSRASERVRGGEERGKLRGGIVEAAGGKKRKREDENEGVNADGSKLEVDEGVKKRATTRMKGPKGPNPLSIKKKQAKPQQQTERGADGGHAKPNDTQEAVEVQPDDMPKAKRKRKHGGKKGDDVEMEVGSAHGVTAASLALQDVTA